MLIVIGEGIIGTNRIFDPCFGPGQFEANKSRVGDEGAERAIETTGGPVGLAIVRARRFLPVTTCMRRSRGIRRSRGMRGGRDMGGGRATSGLGYRANGRKIDGPHKENTKRDQQYDGGQPSHDVIKIAKILIGRGDGDSIQFVYRFGS
jgi:hypothetical protein